MTPTTTHQRLKTCYKPFRSWTPIHTAGEATFSSTFNLLFTLMDEEVVVSNLNSAKRLHTFEGDSSIVTSITCTPSTSNPTLLIAYRSLSIRIYTLFGSFLSSETTTVDLQKSISKAHEAPISISISDPTSSVFATGDTAGVVKLWDVKNGHCTHIFKGHQLVSALSFDVNQSEARARLAVGSSDGKIKLWDLPTNQLITVFEHGHVSVIRGLSMTRDGLHLISGSRDKVLNLWSIQSSKVIKTIPVYETIESIGLINQSEDYQEPLPKSKGKRKVRSEDPLISPLKGLTVFTAGDKGLIRLWDLESGQQIGSEEEKSTIDPKFPRTSIFDTCYDAESQTLLVTKIDQTFSLLSLPSLKIIRQIVGSHDEIIDTSLLNSPKGSATHLALATNSPVIRILSLGAEENHTELLTGHRDVVLCLTKSEDSSWFVSGSKDKSARVWKRFGTEDEQISWDCVGICEGHMQGLGAVSLTEFKDSKNKLVSLLATASQDRTVKLWDLSLISNLKRSEEIHQMKSLLTLKVHEKDINTIEFDQEGNLFATGSQDKLCKVFKLNHTEASGTNLEILGILKGHTRGIWTLKFSKFNKVLVTGSGDCSIKLWSVDQSDHESFGNCLKTFDGHLNAILRLDFINLGQQLVSTSSDSLIKIWEIKTQVCLNTLGDESTDEEIQVSKPKTISDESQINHDSKIWALEIQDDGEKILTAGSDSKIIYWEDITELKLLEKIKLKEEEMRMNQDLENYIRLKDYKTVITLLIKLNKPVRLLRLFNEILEQDEDNDDGDDRIKEIDEVVKELKLHEVITLLKFCRDWNSLSKTQETSQEILYRIFKFHSYKSLLNSIEESQNFLEIGIDTQKENLKKIQNLRTEKESLKEILNTLFVYSERYLNKIEKVNQELNVLSYLLNQMEGGICEF
ncbi:WD40-repeat-containing domain protein [Melampsora americana]|nr:WD40-repeat-containing domain protein [Melampsora americana]